MNKDFSYLLTDICETRGPKGKRMAEYLERFMSEVHSQCGHDALLGEWMSAQEALKDRDCLEEWEEDK